MNDFQVSITAANTKKYPLHRHSRWEIMYYLEGEGHLATAQKPIAFTKGSMIIVPPEFEHGSVSKHCFVNISVEGDFGNLLLFDDITVIQDNPSRDGKQLATLIYKNRHQNNQYLAALCSSYAHFLLQNFIGDKKINHVVSNLIDQISEQFYDPDFDVTKLLNQSGYAEDYIRNEFKKITGLSPVEFLTKIRIMHAQKLLEIYGETRSIAEVAESSGFTDPVYFSKRFRQFSGICPSVYKKENSK